VALSARGTTRWFREADTRRMVLEFSPADPRSLLGHLLARLADGVEALYTFGAGL
jgi:hypothetical protein